MTRATPRTDQEEYTAIANTNSALIANDKQYVVPSDLARRFERALRESSDIGMSHPYAGSTCGEVARKALGT